MSSTFPFATDDTNHKIKQLSNDEHFEEWRTQPRTKITLIQWRPRTLGRNFLLFALFSLRKHPNDVNGVTSNESLFEEMTLCPHDVYPWDAGLCSCDNLATFKWPLQIKASLCNSRLLGVCRVRSRKLDRLSVGDLTDAQCKESIW